MWSRKLNSRRKSPSLYWGNNMKDEKKTKKQLIEELAEMRQLAAKLDVIKASGSSWRRSCGNQSASRAS